MAEENPKDLVEKKPEGQAEAGLETAGQTDLSGPAEKADEPEPVSGKPGAGEGDEGPSLEPSEELKRALDEAAASLERSEEKKRKEKEQPPIPTEQELKLKMEILELRRRVKDLELELENKAREVKQNYDQGMMIKNQFEGYKTRVKREKADWFNYGQEPLLKELLVVLDNFERAVSHAKRPEDFDALKTGIEMIYRQLVKMMDDFGVKQLQTVGQAFNPLYHEALAQTVSLEYPPGIVIEEHTKGYLLKDRLLRASRVTISALPKVEEPGQPAAPGSLGECETKEQDKKPAEVKADAGENPEGKGGDQL